MGYSNTARRVETGIGRIFNAVITKPSESAVKNKTLQLGKAMRRKG
jgi:hypothetical protein